MLNADSLKEQWSRFWARRYLMIQRVPFILMGFAMLLSTGLKDSFIQNTLATIVGFIFIGLAGATMVADWKTKFTPRFWWNGNGKVSADDVRDFCQRKQLSCRIDEDHGPGTGLGFRAGFITEDDLILTQLSL